MSKKVLVAGMGMSGIQAAELLLKQGREVILYDGNKDKDVSTVREKLTGDVEFVLGDLTDDVIARTEFCVISPGISLEVPFAVRLKDAGVEILSEIELAWLYEKGTVVGITGTNGKTTTTTLVGDIIRTWKNGNAFTVGNIGTPYAEEVLKSNADSVSTIELSSFQLESIKTFHPHVSAILNITPDHLNRHHTMECYAAVKEQITMNQTEDDYVILNHEDERLRAFGESGIRANVIWFSGTQVLENGYYLQGDTLYMAENGKSEKLLNTDEVLLVGRCNYENILAAIGITRAMGVPMETILEVAKNFHAVAHRIEFVKEVNGVRYYNDSKGTNPDAAIQGIRAMRSPTAVIGGGYDKGSEYDEWIAEFGTTVKELVLIGQTAEKIAACCKKHGFENVIFADSLEEAVEICRRDTVPGENVLLSPACASWGMFDNYEQRGDIFKELVRRL